MKTYSVFSGIYLQFAFNATSDEQAIDYAKAQLKDSLLDSWYIVKQIVIYST